MCEREYECAYVRVGFKTPLFLIFLFRATHLTPSPQSGLYYAIGIVPKVGKMGITAPIFTAGLTEAYFIFPTNLNYPLHTDTHTTHIYIQGGSSRISEI